MSVNRHCAVPRIANGLPKTKIEVTIDIVTSLVIPNSRAIAELDGAIIVDERGLSKSSNFDRDKGWYKD